MAVACFIINTIFYQLLHLVFAVQNNITNKLAMLTEKNRLLQIKT